MPIRWDDQALVSIPLKLIIVAVVATTAVLPAAQALAGLESREFVRRAEMQLDRVVTAAQVLTVQGPGNVRTLSLDFTSAANLEFEELRVGDRRGGSNSSCAILILSNGALMTRVATDPTCDICSRDMTAFVASQLVFDLRMVAVLHNGTTVIQLEMV
jgi:hypothetical protein